VHDAPRDDGEGHVSRTTSRAERLIEISEMMRLKPRGVAELAREFGVSRRTIERDLEAVARMHPLEASNHRYSIARRGSTLNDVEALAMHGAARLLVHTGVGERHYRSALAKLADQLPEPARATLVRSMDRLSPRGDGRVLDLVGRRGSRAGCFVASTVPAAAGTGTPMSTRSTSLS
jgi:predicted DNA-binding transcriptional regulator YafY